MMIILAGLFVFFMLFILIAGIICLLPVLLDDIKEIIVKWKELTGK